MSLLGSVYGFNKRDWAFVCRYFTGKRERHAMQEVDSSVLLDVALCKLHDPEALTGLQTWACMSFFPLFSEDNRSLGNHGTAGPLSWITGLIYQAKGQVRTDDILVFQPSRKDMQILLS
ncbi:hypothetical protein POM88_032240 [Heracleum sosnowskyi]|uniref:Uncharacterized protein n=1 Tax=Heracleum sosnowskyi TaxID=360622 RepID=A0AAD8I0X4_9APIA|nr:hypothetical protein POM88_032240 [Heracleum sosnowskyi]